MARQYKVGKLGILGDFGGGLDRINLNQIKFISGLTLGANSRAYLADLVKKPVTYEPRSLGGIVEIL